MRYRLLSLAAIVIAGLSLQAVLFGIFPDSPSARVGASVLAGALMGATILRPFIEMLLWGER